MINNLSLLLHYYLSSFDLYIHCIIPEEDMVNSNPFTLFNKACLKNVFTVLLLFIYLVLTAVAVFLAYQTITDFMEKLSHPVMSVTYKEVDAFSPPGWWNCS